MTCPNCGYNNQTGNRFCVRCGVDIAAPPVAETPSFDTAPPAPGGPVPTTPPAGAPPLGVSPPGPSPTAPPAAPNPWGTPHPGSFAAQSQAPPPPPPAYASPPPPTGAPNPFAPPVAAGPPGYPPGAYGQYPMPYPPSGYQPASTNGLAIASLILGLVGWLPCGIGSIVAIILGFVARSQIKAAQGRQGGDGLALAGIILGFIGIGLLVVFFVIGAVAGSNNGQS